MEKKFRVQSIDILRGAIMIIMALDHTRDFLMLGALSSDPMNPETTNPGLFFTRWITHFCAPTFVFLSGISAYLSSKNKSPKETSNFLLKRGLWLIFVEIVVITFALTFNPLYNFIILQVIWAIGWSMIILALLSRISHRLILVVGLLIFFGHNVLNYLSLPPESTFSGKIIAVTFTGSASFFPIADNRFVGLLYVILPWTSVMLIGFAMGKWFESSFQISRRKQLIFWIGLCLFLSFLVLRYYNSYGNPSARISYEDNLQSVYSFLNVSKYPPSLQYFGMTLGISLMVLAGLEKIQNRLTKILSVFGSVPFFFYVIHFFLIHSLLVVIFFIQGYGTEDIVNKNVPFLFHPDTIGFSLAMVYLLWLFVIVALFPLCHWFSTYKKQHKHWWLSYL